MSVALVLVHDHDLYRQGLRLLLEGQEDFRVIGEAAGGLEALQLVQALQPNILVLDLVPVELSGLEVARQVRRQTPGTHVVMLSAYTDVGYIAEALRSGVIGYVLRQSSTASLLQAVREANAGRRYLSPPLSDAPIQVYGTRSDRPLRDPYETLTARKPEVLDLAAGG